KRSTLMRIVRIHLLGGILALLTCTGLAVAWQEISNTFQPVQKGTAVSIVSQMNFRFDRTLIWSTVISMPGLQAISGIKIDAADFGKTLTKIGDSVAGELWSQKGRVVVTAFEEGRELRVVFEPASANYLA